MDERFAFLIMSRGYTAITTARNPIKKAMAYIKYIFIKRYDVKEPDHHDIIGQVISVPILPEKLGKSAVRRCIKLVNKYRPTVVRMAYASLDFPDLPDIKVLRQEGLLRWATGLCAVSSILAIKTSSWTQQEVVILGADQKPGDIIARYLADKVNYLSLVGNDEEKLKILSKDLLCDFGLAAGIYPYDNACDKHYDVAISAGTELDAACRVNADIVLCYPGQRTIFDKSSVVIDGGYIDPSPFFETSTPLTPLKSLYMIELIGWLQGWLSGVYDACSDEGLKAVIDGINDRNIKLAGFIVEDSVLSYNQIRKKLFKA